MFSQQKNWSHILSCVLNYLQIPLVIVLLYLEEVTDSSLQPIQSEKKQNHFPAT
jgi:hypothetical protein